MDESLLLKYLKHQGSEEDFQKVEAWCEQSPENRKVLEQLYYLQFVGTRVEAMEQADTEQSLCDLKARMHRRGNSRSSAPSSWWSGRKTWMPLAVAFLAGLLFMGGLGWGWFSGRMERYAVLTDPGQRAQVVLPDGSKVWLNSSTKLTYKHSFFSRERLVDLTGEAYFEVAHEDAHPFIVNARNIQTHVLGTHFNVRARLDESTVVTTLFKGKVRVDSPLNSEQGKVLKPGQTLLVNAQNYQTELLEYPCPDEVLLWIKGTLHFEQKTLKEITETLERLYDVQFIFKETSIQQERFTCDFSTDMKPEVILSILAQTNRLKYVAQGRIITLSKAQ
ncbi:MAG: DUF4974 domain-containing protein [Bacteroidia bacterium]|nr:DUF4974 domain-containing protein [Bacteroidia bacterium]